MARFVVGDDPQSERAVAGAVEMHLGERIIGSEAIDVFVDELDLAKTWSFERRTSREATGTGRASGPATAV